MIKELDFEQFEKDWKKRHKASLPRRIAVSSLSAIAWIVFWVIVAWGAGVFSAAHTIPAAAMTLDAETYYRQYLATTALVIVEFVIFGAGAKRHEIKWLKWLLVCALLVALIGNMSSSWLAVNANGGTWMNQLTGILLSIIAPVTALAAGDVLHLQLTDLSKRRQVADERYRQDWKDLDAKINMAYTKLEKEYIAQNEAVNSLHIIKSNSVTRSKPSVKLQKAIDYLTENPEATNTPPRDLEEVIGMSYGTIFRAQQHIKQSTNGHSENGHSES